MAAALGFTQRSIALLRSHQPLLLRLLLKRLRGHAAISVTGQATGDGTVVAETIARVCSNQHSDGQGTVGTATVGTGRATVVVVNYSVKCVFT